MLIKIDGDRYINSEHISMIAPGPDPETWFICLLGQGLDATQIETTAAVIAYLTLILDADTHYSDDEVTLSLTSRIAIVLSNSATAKSLDWLLSDLGFPNTPLETMEASINELLVQGVIRSELRDGVIYYSHAANARPFEDLVVLDNNDSGLGW